LEHLNTKTHSEQSVPGAPPQMVKAFPETSTSIRVSWQPPPENKRNGKIVYYKIFYVQSTRSDPEATMIEIEKDSLKNYEFTIDELLKYTEYRLWMLAGTSVGDGPISYPIIVKTDEDGTYTNLSKILFPYIPYQNKM
jgi:netrin-G3 ligand